MRPYGLVNSECPPACAPAKGQKNSRVSNFNQKPGYVKRAAHRRPHQNSNLVCFLFNQKVGHDLASVDELSVLDGGKCILQLRGVRPFKSDKYDLTQHPNYKLTAGADKKNTFSIEAFLDHRLKLKPGDKYEVVDADHAK